MDIKLEMPERSTDFQRMLDNFRLAHPEYQVCQSLINQDIYCGDGPIGHACLNSGLYGVRYEHDCFIVCERCYKAITSDAWDVTNIRLIGEEMAYTFWKPEFRNRRHGVITPMTLSLGDAEAKVDVKEEA